MSVRKRRFFPVLVLAVATALAGVAAARPDEPELEIVGGRWLTLKGLPPILEDKEVEPELETGLTATFVFVVDLQGVSGDGSTGAARIGVRYELWDELFHVTLYSIDGLQKHVVGSREELRTWWKLLRLRVVDLAELSQQARQSARGARVRLDVVPFSQSEQIDTQRWFAESVRRAEAASPGDSSVVVDSEGGDSIFSLLIATSIRSRPLTSFSWTLDLPSPPKP